MADRREALVAQLRTRLRPDIIEFDPDIIAAYSADRCPFTVPGTAWALARPRSTDDVVDVLRAAHATGIPLVPRGAGSGLAGGADAVEGSIVLCLERLDKIIEINPEDRIAVAQAGVITADLKAAARTHGLAYPPDPASSEFCTIGGNVATNAGGLCCIKYGVTRDYVRGLEVVLSDGSVIRTGGRSHKDVAGYDFTSMFVGSEGTLGVITEVTVKLVPMGAPPATALAYFDSLEATTRGVFEAQRTGVSLSMLELMDRSTLRAIESWRSLDLDLDASALVIAQSEGGDIGAVEAALRRAGATWTAATDDPIESDMMVNARKLAYPALERLGPLLLDDVAVPLSRLGALVQRVQEIGHTYGVDVATFGHAGDGNLHPTIVVDDESSARAAFGAILAAAAELGGTVTGEHGIGTLKRSAHGAVTSPELAALSTSLKAVFDPRGLLNPGKLLSEVHRLTSEVALVEAPEPLCTEGGRSW